MSACRVKDQIIRVCHIQIWPSGRTGPSQCCSCAETFRGLSHGSASTSRVWGFGQNGGHDETISSGTCGGLTRCWPLITSSRSSSLEPSRKSWNRSRIMHGGLLCPHIHSSASKTSFKRGCCCLNHWMGIKLFTGVSVECDILESSFHTQLAFYRRFSQYFKHQVDS